MRSSAEADVRSTDDALGDDDAVGLADRLRRREVSADEVRSAVAERVARVDPVLRGLCLDRFDEPVVGDTDGPLAGVPMLVKENTDVAGWPTTNGTTAYVAEPAPAHAEVTKQLLDLGVALLGSTRMPEFGLNATTEFVDAEPTRNPWNTDYSAGASSGGSAALVAAGAVPLAHANDGGGSIRIPAAACGLVGLKPTRGRTALNEQGRQMPINLVSDGVVTRSVRDTAAVLGHLDRARRNPRSPAHRPRRRTRATEAADRPRPREPGRGPRRRGDPRRRRRHRGGAGSSRPRRRAAHPRRREAVRRRLPRLLGPARRRDRGRRPVRVPAVRPVATRPAHPRPAPALPDDGAAPARVPASPQAGREGLRRRVRPPRRPALAGPRAPHPGAGVAASDGAVRRAARAPRQLRRVHAAAERRGRAGDRPARWTHAGRPPDRRPARRRAGRRANADRARLPPGGREAPGRS